MTSTMMNKPTVRHNYNIYTLWVKLASHRVTQTLIFMAQILMMESPVGTTYELRSHSLLPVGPRMTDKADSCGELTTAVVTDRASCICGLVCRDGLTCRTFPSAALLYCSDNTIFLKVLHPGEALSLIHI